MSRSGVHITCRICSRVIPGAKVESRGAAGLVAAIGCGAAAATGAAGGEGVIAGAAGGAENAEEVAWPHGMNHGSNAPKTVSLAPEASALAGNVNERVVH